MTQERRHPQVTNLEGEGSARIGDATVRLRAGDYVTFPTGPESAHILTNTGAGPLRYLCFSTLPTTEVVGYPDSKKIGAMAAASSEAAVSGPTADMRGRRASRAPRAARGPGGGRVVPARAV